MTITAAAARRILRRQGMPRREIRAVLAAEDPVAVRRLLELHRERLEEWLEEQQRLLANIDGRAVDEHRRAASDDLRRADRGAGPGGRARAERAGARSS
jgi:DNA-binding transcriptional MerR regulator